MHTGRTLDTKRVLKCTPEVETMDWAVFYGLAAAVSYGTGDYLAQLAGRAVGLWRSSFYAALLAIAVLSVWLLLEPAILRQGLRAPPSAWWAAIGSGLTLLVASVLFTQALIKGPLPVVAPVTASYGAVTTLLSVASGERFTSGAAIGLALIIAGSCIVSIPARVHERHESIRIDRARTGLGWALGAAVGYGVGFWVQGRLAIPALGALLPVWITYATAVVLLGCLGLSAHVNLALPERAASISVFGSGALGAAGFLSMSAGLATGRVALVAVLSSLTSAITVFVGRTLGDTHLALHQWLAIALIVAGLMLVRT
ncbi:MAG TPA: DMT family transporter [Steroidobacteraceae bacterium]|nr:DMT family transporter [Steroidobacteraceae bacterium]